MPQDTLSQGHGATRKADSAKDLQAEYAKSGKQVRKVDDGRMDAASPNADLKVRSLDHDMSGNPGGQPAY